MTGARTARCLQGEVGSEKGKNGMEEDNQGGRNGRAHKLLKEREMKKERKKKKKKERRGESQALFLTPRGDWGRFGGLQLRGWELEGGGR